MTDQSQDGPSAKAEQAESPAPDVEQPAESADSFRSGFVTLLGRPNAGKSTLINQICGEKVAIVSNKPQTTRTQVRGVLHRPNCQIVFVDTPGIHKPVTALGERLNSTASSAIEDVDVCCLLVDATKPFGRGDQFVVDRMPPKPVVVLNKTDLARNQQVIEQLATLSEIDAEAWFPISARTGDGVDALVEHLVARMPEGPQYFPTDMITDVSEAFRIAELVREQLFRKTRQELPYSIATRVLELSDKRVTVQILVERDSQKGMVIGKGGSLLKEVGIEVRKQLPEGMFVELKVAVDKDWQRRPGRIQELGY